MELVDRRGFKDQTERRPDSEDSHPSLSVELIGQCVPQAKGAEQINEDFERVPRPTHTGVSGERHQNVIEVGAGLRKPAVVPGSPFFQTLAELRRRAPSPELGLLGPASVSWTVFRELAVLLGGPCALLLQLAHPTVASAVDEHSSVASDPFGRGRRTFEAVYTVVFGDLENALAMAERVYRRHERVVGSGDRYRALDPALLLWVHATLWLVAQRVFEAVIRPLNPEERTAFFEESKRVAACYGIPEHAMPATEDDFRHYFQSMIDGSKLAVGGEALRQRRLLFRVPPTEIERSVLDLGDDGPLRLVFRALPSWVSTERLLDSLAAGMLPDRLAESFGYRRTPGERLAHRVTLVASKLAFARMPLRARFHPAYQRAMARLGLKLTV
jgi:uncharacterized protein (DUF2236 family)